MAGSGGGVALGCETGEMLLLDCWMKGNLEKRRSFMKGSRQRWQGSPDSIRHSSNWRKGFSWFIPLDGISIKKREIAPACEEMRCNGILSKSVERYGVMKIYIFNVRSD